MTTFSIIIPVYNAAHTIRRCVESIEYNTFKDLEIILIDDGSKDNSLQICRQLAAEHENIRILANDCNKGVSNARNRGLKESHGRYTMFVDSDDWVEEKYYSTFSQCIEQYGEAFYICGFVNHDEKYNKRTDEYLWRTEKAHNEIDVFEGFKSSIELIYEHTLLQQLWNKAFLTKVIIENELSFDETISIGEDFRFVLEYLECANLNKVVMINNALYHYMRDQESSLMYQVGYESINEPIKNLKKLYELEGLPDYEIEKKIIIDQQHQIEQYAYLIMHNAGMKMREKKRLIMALNQGQGKRLYYHNKTVYMKEIISNIIHR